MSPAATITVAAAIRILSFMGISPLALLPNAPPTPYNPGAYSLNRSACQYSVLPDTARPVSRDVGEGASEELPAQTTADCRLPALKASQ